MAATRSPPQCTLAMIIQNEKNATTCIIRLRVAKPYEHDDKTSSWEHLANEDVQKEKKRQKEKMPASFGLISMRSGFFLA